MHDLASVVVITRNRLAYLKHCLPSIREKANYHPLELIVVDNGSTDGTRQYLTELLANNYIQRVILNSANRFAGAAINQGFRLAKGEFLIRSDDDMVYNQDWLSKLIHGLRQVPKSILQVSVFGHIVPDGTELSLSETHLVNGISVDQKLIGGCNMALTRSAFKQLGEFKELQLAEDADYCDRALRQGFILGQLSNATGTHIDHPSCELCLRYTTYKEQRLENLKRLKAINQPFPFKEDYALYEQWEKEHKKN